MISKPLNFLLVDDDVDDTYLFEQVLTDINSNLRFSSAKDGLDALESLESSSVLPDIIFLDLNMPRMNGIECLKELKKNDSLRNIPVIIYTTSSQSKDIEETMISGAVCFITKPTILMELKNILSAIAGSLPNNLENTVRKLSQSTTTYIVC